MALNTELGDALVDCLQEVSGLLRHAHNVAIEQQAALVNNDAEAITLTCRAQEEVLRRIIETDQRAAAVADVLSDSCGLNIEEADGDALAKALGFPYSEIIPREMDTVSALAKSVKDANEINSQLLKNGMEIITGCIRTLVADNQPKTYSKSAEFGESDQSTGLTLRLDSKV